MASLDYETHLTKCMPQLCLQHIMCKAEKKEKMRMSRVICRVHRKSHDISHVQYAVTWFPLEKLYNFAVYLDINQNFEELIVDLVVIKTK